MSLWLAETFTVVLGRRSSDKRVFTSFRAVMDGYIMCDLLIHGWVPPAQNESQRKDAWTIATSLKYDPHAQIQILRTSR